MAASRVEPPEDDDLRNRLAETEEALHALRSGEADAFVTESGDVLRVAGSDNPYVTFFDAMGEGGVTLDGDGAILSGNPRFATMMNQPLDTLRGTPFLHCIRPEDRFGVAALLARSGSAAGEASLVVPAGLLPVRLSIRTVETDDLPLRCVVVTDLSELVTADAELRIAAIAFESQDGIVVTDAFGTIERVNGAFTRRTGYDASEVRGSTLALLRSGRQGDAFYEGLWRTLTDLGYWQGEVWIQAKSGDVYAEWLTMSAVRGADGAVTHYVGTYSEISKNREAQAEIYRLAYYDPLTQLPNRRLFYDRIDHALAASTRSGHYGALIFLDLDNFKTLNDTHGHDFGDQLLAETARRIRGVLREVDTVARLGGDEFVVLLEDLSPARGLAGIQSRGIGEKLQHTLARPYVLQGKPFHCTSSLGIALFHGHDETADTLLKHADLALYRAKGAGRNAMQFFDPAMQSALDARCATEADLRHAIERNELELFYQPQLDGARRLIGAEALLRWRHPRWGLVQPDAFVPIAEETGLIVPIGEWVMQSAGRQIQAWSRSPVTRDLKIAVNVSARQLRNAEFPRQVRRMLALTGIDPGRLTVEITESLVVPALSDTFKMMESLKALGVGFSLDDFGTGNSSLAYLTRLPLDELKIDRSFVLNLPANRNDAIVVQTILNMASGLGLSVIAEGVETDAQWAFLEHHACGGFQGFLFSQPLPAAEFEAFAASR